MTKLTFFTIIGVFSVSTVTFANSDALAKIETANPNASPYQVLQELYEHSSSPASMDDFDLISDSSSNQKCVGANKESTTPSQIFIARAKILLKKGTPATPSDGPLFPGQPATPDQMGYEFVGSAGASDRGELQNIAENLAERPVITTTSTDLIETVTDSANEESVIVQKARKNGSLISIHAILNAGSNKEQDLYIYCYRD